MHVDLINPSIPINHLGPAKISAAEPDFATMAATASMLHQMKRGVGAALDTDKELIDILIRYGNNSDGIPALHYAIKMKDERAVELLLEHGADPDSLSRQIILRIWDSFIDSSEPLLPLDYAALSGDARTIQLLIDFGANVNPGKIGKAQYEWAGLESEYFRRYAPLFFAARADQEEAVRILIENGAAIEPPSQVAVNPSVPNSPLHIALICGSLRTFRILLDNTPNIPPIVCGPCYMLHDAASRGNAEVVQLLLDRGAYIDIHRGDMTPLMSATGPCVELLLKAGANPKAKTGDGFDALCFAARRGDIEATRSLLKRGVDINALRGTNRISNPLHEACQQWSGQKERESLYTEYLHFLLDNGADINARVNGKTVLAIAKGQNKPELVSWLIAHGAKE